MSLLDDIGGVIGGPWGAALGKAAEYGLAYLSDKERSEAIEAANDEDVQIALKNFGLQEQMFELQQEISDWQRGYLTEQQDYQRSNDTYNRELFEELQRRGLEGTTTPQGTTRYVPGRGMVTELSPEYQGLQDASNNALMRQMTQGSQRNAEIEEGNFERGIDAGNQADVLLREFQNVRRDDPQRIASMITAAGERGYNTRMDETQSLINRELLRRGGTGREGMEMGDAARASADASGQREADALLKAMGYADNKYASERSGGTDLYNVFANRGSSAPAPQAGNVQISGPNPASMPQGGPTSSNGGPSPSINSGFTTPQMPYTGNSYSADANMYGSLASLISGHNAEAKADERWDTLFGKMSGGGTGTGSGTSMPGTVPEGSTFGGTQPQGTNVRTFDPWGLY